MVEIKNKETYGEISEYTIKIKEEFVVTEFHRFVEEFEELVEKYKI